MKNNLLWLCTCTGIEVLTAIGVTLYLIYLNEVTLALIALVVFAKILIFHFLIDYYDKLKSKRKLIKLH